MRKMERHTEEFPITVGLSKEFDISTPLPNYGWANQQNLRCSTMVHATCKWQCVNWRNLRVSRSKSETTVKHLEGNGFNIRKKGIASIIPIKHCMMIEGSKRDDFDLKSIKGN